MVVAAVGNPPRAPALKLLDVYVGAAIARVASRDGAWGSGGPLPFARPVGVSGEDLVGRRTPLGGEGAEGYPAILAREGGPGQDAVFADSFDVTDQCEKTFKENVNVNPVHP